MSAPRLRDDCFALPPGLRWTPVDEALARLRERLAPVVEPETVTLAEAEGRVLAEPALARRAHPPVANAAVDGWAVASTGVGEGPCALPAVEGRAAAGAPLGRAVPPGHVARVLTGAALPEGVDAMILDEDARAEGGRVAFTGPVRRGANVRPAGEDVAEGATALEAGRRLGPGELALLASVGAHAPRVYRRLRVGALSTGDELRAVGEPASTHQIWDANRPMLLAMLRRWGVEAVDLGRAPDDRAALRERLDEAASRCDAILTSGGASAGDEDHVSALLRETGALQIWRVAMKPGRPLALGLWRGAPVFGLPGNPVAAFVCALIFARPALHALAGAGWVEPMRLRVPAAFSKRKKGGRREYLRARLTPAGSAEVFPSEGSGRVSGLAWSTGLVELADPAAALEPGAPVDFLPYAGFGL